LTEGAEWWDSVNVNKHDYYMFAHGHDYKGALMDFTTIAGKIPMIPRYANGIWFTRWFDFNNVDVKKIVNGKACG
jgi:alpha-glucosidase (family GH31 glycosyl hydrolase)